MREFLDTVMVKKFKRVVFVSEENKKDVTDHYKEIREKSVVCNNFINGEEIEEKAHEEIEYKKNKDILFVNVGRQEEHQKKLSRIIWSCKKLIDEGYKFQVLFIGDGPDTLEYKEEVKKKGLEDIILFLGRKSNPFPYYKISDAVLLSSEYEGYPVVFLEAMMLGKPILSTKVSDWEELDKRYGMFCDVSEEGVLNNMRKYLDEGFIIKSKFDYKEYNEDILRKIEDMINK